MSAPERILRCMYDADGPVALTSICAAVGLTPQEAARSMHRLLQRGNVERIGFGIYKVAGPETPGYVPSKTYTRRPETTVQHAMRTQPVSVWELAA